MAINNDIEEWLFKNIEESLQATPYYNLLGIELAELRKGEAVLKVITSRQHTNPIGKIHGGLLTSIADAAMANAIRSLGVKGVTVDMSTAFIAAAGLGDEIIAKGKVVKAGRDLYFAEAEITSNDKILVRCQGTFYKIGEITK